MKAKPVMLNAFLSFLLLSYLRLTNSSQLSNRSEFHPKHIFILAGQSNMAGRGGVIDNKWDGIVPPESQPNPSILRLSAQLNWEEAHEPLHIDIDLNKTCGVGPGMAFANEIKRMDRSIGIVGLVPCAIGGTNISEWSRGRPIYNELVKRVVGSVRDGGTIRAILWYQGESDTVIREDAESYKVNLEKFFWDLRADLGLPMLRIIQVALASGEGPFVETVRNAQLQLDLPNVRCVDAKRLPLEPDGLHLTTTSEARLGHMLAKAFLKNLKTRMILISNAAPKNIYYLHPYLSTSLLLCAFWGIS